MRNLSKIFTIVTMTITLFSTSYAQVLFTEKVGGDSGEKFMLPTTRKDVLSNQNIRRIAIQHNSRRVEQIVMEYATNENGSRIDSIGNDSGNWSFIDLEEGEYIVYVTGRAGTLIDQITFHTTLRRTFGPYGGTGGEPFDLSIPSNAVVIGFFGNYGPSIHQLGLIYRIMNKNKGNKRPPKRKIRDHRKKQKQYLKTFRIPIGYTKSSYIRLDSLSGTRIRQKRIQNI